jgi:phosphonate transport system substrate-binding protein
MGEPIRFATYLAPNVRPVYQAVADHVARELGVPTELVEGRGYERLESGEEDVAFICGLPYVRLADGPDPPIELLAAPVLEGERYRDRPIYFSDVIVRRGSRATCFADLRGRSWAFNEPNSQSGFGVTRADLVRLGETNGFFARVLESGYHQRSIRLVAAGEVDASAIDSQVLGIELRDHPRLAEHLKVIDALGPSTIQPVVAARRLPATLRAALRSAILTTSEDPVACETLAAGMVKRFDRVSDGDYDDIRAMMCVVDAAGLEGFGPVLG